MMRNTASLLTCLFAALACGVLSGCGGGTELPTVAISGKITCNGEPLAAGATINFRPQPAEGATGSDKTQVGKMASAIVGEGGTFTLTTYEEGDGAVIGKHLIVIMPEVDEGRGGEEDPDPEAGGPADEDEEEGDEEEQVAELPCPPPTELYVTLESGNSVVNIEMADGGSATVE